MPKFQNDQFLLDDFIDENNNIKCLNGFERSDIVKV